jgi:DNA (cytosine-5)-methyltransferase 1
MMNELALFAGAGGGILGGKLLGWNTIGVVEIEPYPREVLLQRQREGIFEKPFPIWDDITTFDGRPWKGCVDIISGGFPCQDISAAGKGAGIDGGRSGLWGEMARVINEVRPHFAFVENSPMLTIRGLGRVLGDLSEIGYNARWCVLGADDAGAPHRRKRIWILAYSESVGSGRITGEFQKKDEQQASERQDKRIRKSIDASERSTELADTDKERRTRNRNTRAGGNGFKNNSKITWWDSDPADLPDTNSIRCNVRKPERERIQRGKSTRYEANPRSNDDRAGEERTTKPVMGRVAHGVARRVDRLKAIGNGQVPGVAAIAFTILSEGLI